jgi:hypothetical protein
MLDRRLKPLENDLNGTRSLQAAAPCSVQPTDPPTAPFRSRLDRDAVTVFEKLLADAYRIGQARRAKGRWHTRGFCRCHLFAHPEGGRDAYQRRLREARDQGRARGQPTGAGRACLPAAIAGTARPAGAPDSSRTPLLSAASVLQASGFRSDVAVFRLNARPRRKLARNLHLGGIRRNACPESRRLITRRSQVQILPPLLERPWKQGLSLVDHRRCAHLCKRLTRPCDLGATPELG